MAMDFKIPLRTEGSSSEVPRRDALLTELKTFPALVGNFAGINIIEDRNLMVTIEDWSKVRSPSRAIRRLKRGFKQNVVSHQVPDTKIYMVKDRAIMHPDVGKKLREKIVKMNEDILEKAMHNGIRGSTL